MAEVEMRKLGSSGLAVPALGVGTLAWGNKTFQYGKQYTKEDLRQVYKTAIDVGLNFFDTSDDYGGLDGQAERLIGEFLKEDGRPIVVATKFTPFRSFTPYLSHRTPKSLLDSVDASLGRLGVDCIDLFHLHYPPQGKLDNYLDAMIETVRSGKVRHLGISNFDAKGMRYVYEYFAKRKVILATNEIGYSLLQRYAEVNDVLDVARELNVGLIGYKPLAEGVLTGGFRHSNNKMLGAYRLIEQLTRFDFFHEDVTTSSLRHFLRKPHTLPQEKLEPLFATLEEIASMRSKTIPQVVLNWILCVDPLLVPIPGAKKASQVQSNVEALGWRLTQEEFMRISESEISTR